MSTFFALLPHKIISPALSNLFSNNALVIYGSVHIQITKINTFTCMKKLYFVLAFHLLIWTPVSFAQTKIPKADSVGNIVVSRLMDSLWVHPTSFFNRNDPNWIRLNQHLKHVNILQLNNLIHSVYFGKSSFFLNLSHSEEGFIGVLNKEANNGKMKKFHKKIRSGFRDRRLYPQHKVVLIEGDSWFEYPVFLNDITDYLMKYPNLAIYSLAHGGDWVSNMISSLKYEFDYVKINPDVVIISGGGNDLVGDSRLSGLIRLTPKDKDDPFLQHFRDYVILRMMHKSVPMCNEFYCPIDYQAYGDSMDYYRQKIDTSLVNQIVTGRRYLNKNFYRWTVTTKLEYKILFESLRKVDTNRFKSVKIITQGYDYAIPSFHKRFGLRMLMDNGEWLKEPLMAKGIIDPYVQKSIVKTLIFEFNEMLIELGKEYNNVYHVDARGFTHFYETLRNKRPGTYWYDELHPKNVIFKNLSAIFAAISNGKIPKDQKVVNAIEYFKAHHLLVNKN